MSERGRKRRGRKKWRGRRYMYMYTHTKMYESVTFSVLSQLPVIAH